MGKITIDIQLIWFDKNYLTKIGFQVAGNAY